MDDEQNDLMDTELPPPALPLGSYMAAQLAALNALAVLDRELEDLDKVKRIVKMTGSVASSPGFTNQPGVINAASDALVTVLGERGRHARMAVGVAELPGGAPVAVELIARVRD